MRILIVDDSFTGSKILSRILCRFDCNVCCAENSDHALKILETNPDDYFDVIFIDAYMPGECNGIELSCIIKQSYNVSTIIVGMGIDLEDELLFREANADLFIVKPLDVYVITKFIRDLQNGHHFCTKDTIHLSNLITYTDSTQIDNSNNIQNHNNNNNDNNERLRPKNSITCLCNWFI